MKAKLVRIIPAVLLIAVILAVKTNSQAACKINATPKLNLPAELALNEDTPFLYDINLSYEIETNVIFSWVPINLSLAKFDVGRTTGIIRLTPKAEDAGYHTL